MIVGQRLVGAQPAVAGLLLVLDYLLRAREPALPVPSQAGIERTSVRVMEAEVWRTCGELPLMTDGGRPTTEDGDIVSSVVRVLSSFDEAEACFRRVLDVSRVSGAVAVT